MPDEETTNKVLETKIDGLAKLTDTQLSHVNDALKDLKVLVADFATKAALEEVRRDFSEKIEESNKNYNASIKRIEEGFKQHNEDDKVSFGGLASGQEKMRDTLKFWAGGLAIIAIALPIIVPIILHYGFGF